jgi:hypothetical protein
MSKMIDILVDDRKFVLSRYTLNINPDFPITRLLEGTITIDAFPFIERIDEKTFRIDTNPAQFEKVVQHLRSLQNSNDQNALTQFKMNMVRNITTKTNIVPKQIKMNTVPQQTQTQNQFINPKETLPFKKPSRVDRITNDKTTTDNKTESIFRKSDYMNNQKRLAQQKKSDVYVGLGTLTDNENTTTSTSYPLPLNLFARNNNDTNTTDHHDLKQSEMTAGSNATMTNELNTDLAIQSTASAIRSTASAIRSTENNTDRNIMDLNMFDLTTKSTDTLNDTTVTNVSVTTSAMIQTEKSEKDNLANEPIIREDNNGFDIKVAPKQPHIYKSRKIEFNTSEDN